MFESRLQRLTQRFYVYGGKYRTILVKWRDQLCAHTESPSERFVVEYDVSAIYH